MNGNRDGDEGTRESITKYISVGLHNNEIMTVVIPLPVSRPAECPGTRFMDFNNEGINPDQVIK